MQRRSLWVGLLCVASAYGCKSDNGQHAVGGVIGATAGSSVVGNGGAGGAIGATGGAGAVTSGNTAGAGGVLATSGSGGAKIPPNPSTGGTPPSGMAGMAGRSSSGMSGRGISGSGGTAGTTTGAAGSQGAAGSGCAQDVHCKLTAPPSTGDIRQDCVDRINQFRTQCACLPPLARWTEAEGCADMMAQYDSGMPNSPHAGFKLNPQLCTPHGNAQDECPGWRSNEMVVSGCLQSMWDEGPPPMSPCNDACFQMYGHFINMSSTSSTKVACGFYTTSDGKIWAVQNFSR